MSETNETEGKTARGGRKMTLNVRRTVESGHVRQSFSHGRSKSVLVEKKKRRSIGSEAAQPVEDLVEPVGEILEHGGHCSVLLGDGQACRFSFSRFSQSLKNLTRMTQMSE